MAKKVAKKEAPAAKTKKTVSKPAAKPSKAVKAPAKSVAKVAEKPVKKTAAVVKAVEKPAKVAAKGAKPVKAKEVQEETPVAKKEKAPAKVAAVEVEAPKKEKKVKFDKTGMTEDQIKWTELHEKYKGTKAPAYTISAQYEAKTPVEHKIFGWGYILSNEYDRLEVLFEDGKRMLMSNRKMT